MTFPATPPAPAPTKKLSRPAIIGIVAGGLVSLLVLGAAAFALVQIVLGGGQSASASAVAFPKSTVYWTEFAIDPSNAQRIEAYRFISAIESLEEAIDDSDLDFELDDLTDDADFRESLWQIIVEGDSSQVDTDLDYDDDIKPWLGSRLSVGLVATDDFDEEEPPLIVAVEARDTAAGIDAVEELLDDLDVDAEVDARNGYVVIATGGVDLDDVYDEGTLDRAEGFTAVSAESGDWGIASVFVDLGALYTMVGDLATGASDAVDWRTEIENNYYAYVDDSAWEDYEDCSAFDSPDNVGDETFEDFECDYYYAYNGQYYRYYDDFARAYVDANIDDLVDQKRDEAEALAEQFEAVVKQLEGTTVFAVARFTEGSFEITGTVAGVNDMPEQRGFGGQGNVPESTMMLLSFAGLGAQVDEAFSDENLALLDGTLAFSPYSTESLTRDDVEDWFSDTLDLDFPESLDSLFGTNLELVMDSDIDLDEFANSGSSFGDIVGEGVAVVVTTDNADATVDAWETLIDSLEDQSGENLDLDVEKQGNRVVISGGRYLDTVLDPDGTLDDTQAFRRAAPNAKGASAVVYLDIAALVDLIDDVSGGDFGDYTDGLQAIGMTQTPLSDSGYRFVLRVTTDAD